MKITKRQKQVVFEEMIDLISQKKAMERLKIKHRNSYHLLRSHIFKQELKDEKITWRR